MNIYLIGMMGSGKTTLGLKLAQKLSYEFIDLDDLVVKKENKTINEIFAGYGEEYFRELETSVLKDVCLKNNCIISCGGGIVTKDVNLEYMYGLVFYLQTDLETLKCRLVDDSSRPLLQSCNLDDIFTLRKDMYLSFSDYVINESTVDDCIVQIEKHLSYPKKKIMVVNGPNLNLLNKRNKEHYGKKTLDDINELISNNDYFEYEFFQSNHEGDIVDKLQTLDEYDGVIINPAAYTHTSIAIRDCLEMFDIPKIEVHLSDVNNREQFRKINYFSEICTKSFTAMHEFSYLNAVNYLKKYFLCYN